MCLQAAQRVEPKNTKIADAINAMFEALRDRYEKNFDDIAVRLGNMILLSSETEVRGAARVSSTTEILFSDGH